MIQFFGFFLAALRKIQPRLFILTVTMILSTFIFAILQHIVDRSIMHSFPMIMGGAGLTLIGSITTNLCATHYDRMINQRLKSIKELRQNHHLVRAFGQAISLTLTHAITQNGGALSRNDRDGLHQLAARAEEIAKYMLAETTDGPLRRILDRVALSSLVINDKRHKLFRQKEWRIILQGLLIHIRSENDRPIELSGDGLAFAATQMDKGCDFLFKEILKHEFTCGGAAWAAFQIELGQRMFVELATLNATPVAVASGNLMLNDIMQGFAKELEAAGVPIYEKLDDLLLQAQGVRQSLTDLRRTVALWGIILVVILSGGALLVSLMLGLGRGRLLPPELSDMRLIADDPTYGTITLANHNRPVPQGTRLNFSFPGLPAGCYSYLLEVNASGRYDLFDTRQRNGLDGVVDEGPTEAYIYLVSTHPIDDRTSRSLRTQFNRTFSGLLNPVNANFEISGYSVKNTMGTSLKENPWAEKIKAILNAFDRFNYSGVVYRVTPNQKKK